MTLLKDDEWSQWSNHEISRQCAVSESFVRSLRTKRSEESSEPPPPRTYTTKHGHDKGKRRPASVWLVGAGQATRGKG